MKKIHKLVIAVFLLAMPAAAFAAGAGSGAYPNIGIPNPVPGGITLVPGTVVTPGVGGSAVTGTVPLAGTVGSAGVGGFNPGLGPTPNPDAVGRGGNLYPPTYYPQIPLPNVLESTMPRGVPLVPGGPGIGTSVLPNPYPNGLPPGAVCAYPSGTC
jgi:hypothetical protein